VVLFDRPGPTIPADPWFVTAAVTSGGAVDLQIGTIIGAGGVTIYNPYDPNGPGRVYSAQATEVLSPVEILSPRLETGNFCFGFLTDTGQSYTVQQNTNLATANWVTCTNVLGNGSLMQLSLPNANLPQSFFRISEP
jgi:hypothetical protein